MAVQNSADGEKKPQPAAAVATKGVEEIDFEVERMGEDVQIVGRSSNLFVTLKLILPPDEADRVGRELIEAAGEVE